MEYLQIKQWNYGFRNFRWIYEKINKSSKFQEVIAPNGWSVDELKMRNNLEGSGFSFSRYCSDNLTETQEKNKHKNLGQNNQRRGRHLKGAPPSYK
jgi:hypothetical protein